jgi:sterol desaturase/sphingolipid hydroxylase (fatty acid hydroxylase superfamily)
VNYLIRFVLWAIGSCFVSEFLGYLLHRLLHSDKIHILSRSHMEHHLLLYGPLAEQRPEGGYLDATGNRPALGNVGLEWLIPGGVLLLTCVVVLNLLGVQIPFQITFVAFALAWSFATFSYAHDGMHIRDFWMGRIPIVRAWFLKARLRHDIHHQQISDEGLMDKNFGIGLSIFDRILGTHLNELRPFNGRGYKAASRRYSFVKG